MSDELDEFACLWDGSEPGWVVLECSEGSGLPFNTRTHMVKLIELGDLAKRVCQHMKEEGCEVLKEIPKGPWNPLSEQLPRQSSTCWVGFVQCIIPKTEMAITLDRQVASDHCPECN